MELATLSYTELLALRTQVEAKLKERDAEEKAAAKRQILEIAKASGLSLEDILGKSAGGATRKPVAAKYQHPSDPSLTWTGRGRKPMWVQTMLDEGHSLDSMAIPV